MVEREKERASTTNTPPLFFSSASSINAYWGGGGVTCTLGLEGRDVESKRKRGGDGGG